MSRGIRLNCKGECMRCCKESDDLTMVGIDFNQIVLCDRCFKSWESKLNDFFKKSAINYGPEGKTDEVILQEAGTE